MTHPLRRYIDQRAISVTDFAKALEIDRTTLHRYMQGTRRPTFPAMRKIYLATGGAVSPTDLVMYVETH